MQQGTFALKDLKPNEENLRQDPQRIKELRDSIEANGLLTPLLVRPDGTIVAGHRRYLALVQLYPNGEGDTEVPVVIQEMDDTQVTQAMLVENLQREDLNPIEEAVGYQRLVDFGLTQVKVAQSVGLSQAHVSKRLSLLRLPPLARNAVIKGTLPIEFAYVLVDMADAPTDIMKEAIAHPPSIPSAVNRWKRAKAQSRLEELAASKGVVTIRMLADAPRMRGASPTTAENCLTIEEVEAFTLAEDEVPPVWLVRVNVDNEATAWPIQYVPNSQREKSAEERQQDERRKATEVRRDKLTQIVSQRPGKKAVTDLLVAWYGSVDTHTSGTVADACKILGLNVLRVPDPFDSKRTIADYTQTLQDAIDASPVHATQAILALLLAQITQGGRAEYRMLSETARMVLDTLGYEPDDTESQGI